MRKEVKTEEIEMKESKNVVPKFSIKLYIIKNFFSLFQEKYNFFTMGLFGATQENFCSSKR